jgi:hypothetical protein
MLYEGFRKIFWGFILVFLEIHLMVIDILPDPIGYYLIFSGINLLNNYFGVSSKGKEVAFGLVVLSLPTLFIQNQAVEQMSGAAIYLSLIGIVNLVLAFYLFQLMVSIATKKDDDYLLKRTTTTFRVYMVLMLLFTLLESFFINMTQSVMSGFILFSAIVGLVMNILFLILLSKFSKLPDDGNGPTDSNEPTDNVPPISSPNS